MTATLMTWTKGPASALKGVRGPFVAHITPKGDGRWDWKIFADEKPNPLAVGVSVTSGAARTKCEQFVERQGRI